MADRDSILLDYSTCKDECNKNILDLGSEICHMWNLSTLLGTQLDTDILRDQLRHSRKRAYELAKFGRLKQLPMLRSYIGKGVRSEEYEYLGTLLTSAMELLIVYLRKTVSILEHFKVHNTTKLIKTGMTGSKGSKCHFSSNSAENKPANVVIQEDIDAILKHIQALRCMVTDIYETVDFKPWNIAPRQQSVIAATADLDSCSGPPQPRAGFVSVRSKKYVKSRRCKCLAAVVAAVVIVTLTVVIGLVVGLRK